MNPENTAKRSVLMFGELLKPGWPMAQNYSVSKAQMEPFQMILTTLREHPGTRADGAQCSLKPDGLIARRHSEILRVIARSGDTHKVLYIKRSRLPSNNASERTEAVERGKKEFETAEMVCELFDNHPQFGTLHPLVYYPEALALVMEECRGEPLLTLLPLWYDLWQAKAKIAKAAPFCYLAGKWLRHFHEAASHNGRPMLAQQTIPDGIRLRLERLKSYGTPLPPALERKVQAFVERNQRFLHGKALQQTVIHGDFCPANMLVHQGKLTVIDFSTTGEGPIYHDLTHFLLHLKALARYPAVSKALVQSLEHEFLKGYGQPDLENEPAIHLLQVLQTVGRLRAIARKKRTANLRDKIALQWQWQHLMATLKDQTCEVSYGKYA